MGWLIFLLVVFLLAILPLGASVRYNEDGPLIRVLAGPVRIIVFPRKKKDKSGKKEKKKPRKEKKNKKSNASDGKIEVSGSSEQSAGLKKHGEDSKDKRGGNLLDFLPLVKVGIDFLGDFRGKLRLNVLYIKLVMAGDDPCDLAVNYGRAWAAVGNVFPWLERWFVIKKRDVQVECDFTADKTLITVRLDVTITLGRIIALVVRYGIRALKEYLKISKTRKGGAVK